MPPFGNTFFERSPKGAVRVMAAIYAAIEFISRYPDSTEMASIPGVRGKIVPRFQFQIFYRVLGSDDIVEIVHIRHTSRRPWSGEND